MVRIEVVRIEVIRIEVVRIAVVGNNVDGEVEAVLREDRLDCHKLW